MKKDRILYLDTLRVISCIAVIVLHVAASKFYSVEVHSLRWNIFNVVDSLVRFAVPIFVMISGVLFLNPNKKIDVKKLYLHNILKLVIIFAFWSLVYLVFDILIYDLDKSIKLYIKKFLIGPGHLWFIYMLIGIYMMIPILRKIAEDKNIMKYFLILSMIFGFVIPNINSVLKYNTMINLYNKLNIQLVVGYTFYFILGYYLSTLDFKKVHKVIIYMLGIIGIISTIFLTRYLSYRAGKPIVTFYEYLTVNVALVAMAVFVFIKDNFENKKINTKIEKIINFISKNSLGIYLCHILILSYLLGKTLNVTTLTFNLFLSIPAISIIVFVGSLIISEILHHIPIFRKYVV